MSKYIIEFDDGTYKETDSYFEWIVFSRLKSPPTKEQEELESKIAKWIIVIFVGFVALGLLYVRFTQGHI